MFGGNFISYWANPLPSQQCTYEQFFQSDSTPGIYCHEIVLNKMPIIWFCLTNWVHRKTVFQRISQTVCSVGDSRHVSLCINNNSFVCWQRLISCSVSTNRFWPRNTSKAIRPQNDKLWSHCRGSEKLSPIYPETQREKVLKAGVIISKHTTTDLSYTVI